MHPQPSPPRLSGLCLFVAAYVSLFAIAGVLLFGPGIFPSRAKPVVAEQLAGLQWPYLGPGLLNCTSLQDLAHLEFIAGGWTKAVYRVQLAGGREVAVKTVNLNGHELEACQARGETLPQCYSRAAAKLVREMILLTELAPHENLIHVLGSCVPESRGPVAVVTELGEPLDTVRLLQLTWEDRLQLALGVARILALLAHSRLGSLAMNDFRRQQFVLVRGVLKLSDVDDIGLAEPTCDVAEDCSLHLPEELRHAAPRCEVGRCTGHNERVNVWRAGRHFIKHLLPLGVPSSLKPHVRRLLEGYADASWSAREVLAATEQLVHEFAAGQHLGAAPDSLTGYEAMADSDLPGRFDYACPESRSAVNCVRSVHDQAEAAQLCDADPKCRAVVLEPRHTWTGRTLAVFKSGVSAPKTTPGHQLLVKRTIAVES